LVRELADDHHLYDSQAGPALSDGPAGIDSVPRAGPGRAGLGLHAGPVPGGAIADIAGGI